MKYSKTKQIRIWVDGCFDTMHFGHANALRQAKAMGDFLVVGVHSDKEIEKNKGSTVVPEADRLLLF
jgi:ethanolamine-phosphate cytidylyltransferase